MGLAYHLDILQTRFLLNFIWIISARLFRVEEVFNALNCMDLSFSERA